MTATNVFSQAQLRLENGDRMSRAEFEYRYHQMGNLKKAELIEGVVYVPSPLRYYQHGLPHSYLMGWLTIYAAATPGVEVADNATVRLDLDNEPQPDGLLRLEESAGGRSRISEDDYVEGAPELIIEVTASTVSYDLHDKKQVYRRNGVQEYLVWLVEDQKFYWYVLTDNGYQPQEVDESGLFKSRVFPGLWLDADALLRRDLQQVFNVIQNGVSSQDHQNFIDQETV